MTRLVRATVAVGALLLVLFMAPATHAQTPGSQPAPRPGTATTAPGTDPNVLVAPSDNESRPPGRRFSANQVIARADRVAKIARVRREHPGSTRRAFLKGLDRWQVSYYAKRRPGEKQGKEIGQVAVLDTTGRVLEAWTGFQVAWTMARGYEGAFGRKVNAPYVWIPLCLLFLLPFLRPPLRLLHLDLLVLLAFSVSYAYFSAANIDVSVPLVYPLMLYLLARMLAIAVVRARRDPDADAEEPAPLRLLTPEGFLGIALVFLIGFRVGLNLTNSNVIDVGYSGVIGADRLLDGAQLWGNFPPDNPRGDTYGPVAYLAYVPFELIWPWVGRWDELNAAHAAAIAFDLLAIAGLYLAGRRLGGPRLGILLAYLWAAYPFTLLVSNSGANDSLVAVLVVGALLVAGSPPARGALVALAGLTKFAPLALAPLFATYRGGGRPSARESARRIEPLVVTGVAFVAVCAVVLIPAITNGGLETFYDRTIGFQRERGSPFSIWGLYEGMGTWQDIARVLAGGLALALAFVPRRRDVISLAALSAAILIVLQLTITHWFYLYLVWFLPVVLVALLAGHGQPGTTKELSAEPHAEPERSTPPAAALQPSR